MKEAVALICGGFFNLLFNFGLLKNQISRTQRNA